MYFIGLKCLVLNTIYKTKCIRASLLFFVCACTNYCLCARAVGLVLLQMRSAIVQVCCTFFLLSIVAVGLTHAQRVRSRTSAIETVHEHGVRQLREAQSHTRSSDYYMYYDPGTPSPTRTPRPSSPSSNSSSSSTSSNSSSGSSTSDTTSSTYYSSTYDDSSSSSDDDDDNHNGLWTAFGFIGAIFLFGLGFILLIVFGSADRL